MKKYLLLIISMLCVSIGAWADLPSGLTVTDNGGSTITINSSTAGLIEANMTDVKAQGWPTYRNFLKITGNINQADITSLAAWSEFGNQQSNTMAIDFSGATIAGEGAFSANSNFKGIGLPSDYDFSSFSGTQTFAYYIKDNDVYLHAFSSNGVSDFISFSQSNNWANAIAINKVIHLSGNYGDFETAKTSLIGNSGAGATNVIKVVPVSNDPYTVDGCDVVINMAKAEEGQTLDDLIALAKTAMTTADPTQTNICKLTVQGELTNNDLIALGGAKMTGATRIDLSGATLGSGVTIDNIQLPATLEQLVLPKDQMFSVGLKSKLTAATNLNYAYTPSSDCTATGPNQADATNISTYSYDDRENTIADYVWVNKADGLKQAFENEEQLRNSFYIKVASDVALTETDVNFNGCTNKPTNYLFLDFSESNLTPAVAASYKVTDQIGYCIILPNDWTNEQMEVFAGLDVSLRGNLAAVYSYAGTTLKIMEIDDVSYLEGALKNPRIVRRGTTAIEVVGENTNKSGSWKQYGNLGNNLIAALNQADDDTDDEGNPVNNIKSITINIGSAAPLLGDISFTNTNIETLAFTGVKNMNNLGTGPSLTVTGCTSLTTLDVSNSTLRYLDAHGLTSLTSVNMNGTLVTTANEGTGTVNLSSTGLRTLTTNSSTDIKGSLNLAGSTALTSFATQAKITGDISLNACSSLTSLDISGTQFQNSNSKIHVHATDSESDNNVLSGLNNGTNKTILLPAPVNNVHFDQARIHPNTDLEDNMAEAATSGDGSKDSDLCYIEYDADTKTATAHINTAGHLADLLYSSYASYPEGTTFKFAAGSQINEYDLEALAGYIKKSDNTEADYSWRTNYYYVDLYDLTATDELCNNETGEIGKTINWLRTNNRQFKGLILPKDHTLYGSGISLIQSENPKHEGELSTCSEFIAYFKTQNMDNNVVTDLPKKILFTHVYNAQAGNSAAIQASNDKLTELLAAHGLNGAATNCPVDLYSVSTNGTTPFNATALVGSKGYVETFNNEMVGPDTRANIYAYPSAAGEFTTFVNYSSIGVTTTEVLKIDGTVSSDASAVAASINRFTNGPRVLDLTGIEPNSDEFLSALLPALTNSNIQYIILPGNKSKSLVCGTSYTNMANLKAVISSSDTTLVAYVKVPGSLAEARYLATGGSTDGTVFSPSQTGLKRVTLTGSLNASDISANTTSHFLDENGHWKTTSGNQKSVALWGEQGTISTIDLKDAVFTTQTDMNFSYAGLSSLHDITLPTSASMTLIPAECFMGITTFNDLCIPYNYTKIDNAALLDTYCGHITTTDALNGAVVDNGEHSYTFSANLEEIGSKPSNADANGVYSLDRVVFPQNRGVTDVYVLAHNVPKCYANAFPANMLYGWGGFKGGNFPYCREKYDNSVDGSMIFTVLHFPDKASYTAAAEKTGSSYEEMEKLYTDINKVYTKKEQTGAVDANGDPIAWPTFAELRRAYNQATAGAQWYDWNIEYDGQGSINGGTYIPVGTGEYTTVPTGTDPNTSEKDYDFSSYEGWHQFVLSMATYVEPAKTIENKVIKTNYVQGAWYTLCIPFSLTYDQAVEMLGIPKSVEGKTENYLNSVLVESDQIPDIRTLQTVTRTPGTTNTVTMKFTQSLVASYNDCRYWNINTENPDNSDYAGTGANSDGEKIAIRGGYPYLIRPYLPANEVVNNLGKYIMTRFSQELKQEMSCIYLDGCSQDLADYNNSNKTGRFAKPFENHKIQAAWDDNDNSTPKYRTHSNGKNYNYTFVGQFWDQRLPRYSFYMVENSSNTAGKWYRLASEKSYKWNQYKCIIMVTPENNESDAYRSYLYTNSGKFRNNDQTATTHSIYPASTGTDAQGAYKFTDHLYIEFLNGLDDADFEESAGPAAARYVITFDDIIQELDEDGNSTTAIESLDGEPINKMPTDGKVYNLSGQLVGNSIDGLEKGMYIVNGKKYIVR